MTLYRLHHIQSDSDHSPVPASVMISHTDRCALSLRSARGARRFSQRGFRHANPNSPLLPPLLSLVHSPALLHTETGRRPYSSSEILGVICD